MATLSERKTDWLAELCPVRTALDVIGGRWKPCILYVLWRGVARFTELKRALPGVTGQALTVQLRQLEADGVLRRRIVQTMPVTVEYRLTRYGRTLAPLMRELGEWGKAHLARRPETDVGVEAAADVPAGWTKKKRPARTAAVGM